MAAPEGWTDMNNELTAPNGNKVVLGFRQYILTHDWQSDDVPLENEHGESGSGGTAQLFACTKLRYTPAKGVFKDDIGRQLEAAQQRIAALDAQLARSQPGALTDGQKAALKAAEEAGDGLKRAFP